MPSWFSRSNNKSQIPPVAEQPPASSNSSFQSSTTSPPSYRSGASTYVASRDGDLSDPRAWGKDPNSFRPAGQSYGTPQGQDYQSQYNGGYGQGNSGPNKLRKDSGYSSEERSGSGGGGYERPNQYNRKDSGYGGEETGAGGWNDPKANLFNRGQSNREAFDPYSRGGRNLDADRNALFSGSAPVNQGAPNRFGGSSYNPAERRPAPNPGEENEEDLEAIKSDIRNVKNDTFNSMSNALRIARQAEQTGMATFAKLGTQSEKLADTERNLDESKGQLYRAEDNTDEIRKLNRSIFIPAVTFNKEGKRLAQERRREARFNEEQEDRALAMQDIRETQNRLGRTTGFGARSGESDDGEGIGRRQLTSGEMRLRQEERKRYQFEATASDDEGEDRFADDLDDVIDATKNLKALGLAIGSELDSQNNRLERISDKTDKLGMRVHMNTAKLSRLQR